MLSVLPGCRRRLLAGGLIVATLVSAIVASTPAAAQSRCKGRSRGPSGWTAIRAPRFPADQDPETMGLPFHQQSPLIRVYAVDELDPRHIVVGNEASVMQSRDGGCTWELILSVRVDTPYPATVKTTGEVHGISMSPVPSHKGNEPLRPKTRIYVWVGAPRQGPALGFFGPDTVPLRVLMTDNGGQTWVDADEGLPPLGQPTDLQIAPSNASVLYVVVELGDSTRSLYRSADGGRSWTLRSTPVVDSPFSLRTIRIDPLDEDELWGFLGGVGGVTEIGERTLAHSTDGGKMWDILSEIAQTNTVGVWHRAGRPARVQAFHPENAHVSYDGGQSWGTDWSVPFGVEWVAYGVSEHEAWVAAAYFQLGGGFISFVHRWDRRLGRWIDVSPEHPQSHMFSDLSAVTSRKGTRFYVLSAHRPVIAKGYGHILWEYTEPGNAR